jgi:hypothetical protein
LALAELVELQQLVRQVQILFLTQSLLLVVAVAVLMLALMELLV